DTFENVRSSIDAINEKHKSPPPIPIDLDAEETIVTAEPDDRDVLLEQVAILESSLEYLKGKDKKAVQEEIDTLKMAIDALGGAKKMEGGSFKAGGNLNRANDSGATAWDFVEKYYPNYNSSSNEITRNADLHDTVHQSQDSVGLLRDEFNGDREAAGQAMRESDTAIYKEAIKGFLGYDASDERVDEFVKEYNNGHPELQEPHFALENAIGNYIYRHPEEEFKQSYKKGGKLSVRKRKVAEVTYRDTDNYKYAMVLLVPEGKTITPAEDGNDTAEFGITTDEWRKIVESQSATDWKDERDHYYIEIDEIREYKEGDLPVNAFKQGGKLSTLTAAEKKDVKERFEKWRNYDPPIAVEDLTEGDFEH
ncbi:MAG: hypothetical protein AAB649_03640, partial [Patescibacteria group bacterium]